MQEFIRDYVSSGQEWEKICNSCYRIRYQEQGYQEIPASYKGDGGIEGYTKTGIVYQCYCPEKNYKDDDLYEHMRNKMTTDVSKFISREYACVLRNLGIRNVKEWHFVVPEYKDKRILEHAARKTKEVLAYKAENAEQCDYISEDFTITIKVAEDFYKELYQIIRMELGVKIDLTVLRKQKINWTECDNEKVNNVKRKIRAVMNDVDEEDEDFEEIVNTYMESYVIGLELMDKLRKEQVDIYEKIMELEESYKRQVAIKTKTNMDSSMNHKLFMEIMEDFQRVLKEEFPYMDHKSIGELREDMISRWLADCSMQFRR